jgi:hypothetical protein
VEQPEGEYMKPEHWMRTHWRPMMAYVYMAVVIFDFILGPVFWSIVQIYGGSVSLQWVPLTLISGGIFHAAMGAVLGISAFSRGREKIESLKATYQNGQDNDNKE